MEGEEEEERERRGDCCAGLGLRKEKELFK